MTKPADSGQIAKAREQRAIKFTQDWVNEHYAAKYPGQILDEIDVSGATEMAVAFASSERQAVIEECAKTADQIAQSCSACSYSREKYGEEPRFCENFGCSSFADLAAAIRSME